MTTPHARRVFLIFLLFTMSSSVLLVLSVFSLSVSLHHTRSVAGGTGRVEWGGGGYLESSSSTVVAAAVAENSSNRQCPASLWTRRKKKGGEHRRQVKLDCERDMGAPWGRGNPLHAHSSSIFWTFSLLNFSHSALLSYAACRCWRIRFSFSLSS